MFDCEFKDPSTIDPGIEHEYSPVPGRGSVDLKRESL